MAACSVYCRLKAVTILVDEDARARARARISCCRTLRYAGTIVSRESSTSARSFESFRVALSGVPKQTKHGAAEG